MDDHVKVLMIEDHQIVRDGCQRILSRRSNIETAEAISASEGIALNRDFNPDVIVLDAGLPDASGFDIIGKLLADNAHAKVIIFSMYEAPHFVSCALEKGARGYITKSDDPNAILQAIDRVRTGGILSRSSRRPASRDIQSHAGERSTAEIEPKRTANREASWRG